ncbi:hypothetical protein CYMTET_7258 [Cymbomonas tetramitiformis]|uniref:EF-hand domain-containing protein n=1 Tax=Cymbomonas tetramitiformis TaxID=36881 RepID=A0AAE0LHM9_9CHLO|nr:hypothetical protein CYMTET_7258 [Cymbomonas tetramitiformis]
MAHGSRKPIKVLQVHELPKISATPKILSRQASPTTQKRGCNTPPLPSIDGGARPQNEPARVKAIREFDFNGDGQISFEEFRKACGQFGKAMSNHKMKQLFAKMDKSGDGFIDVAEFMTSDLMKWAKPVQEVDPRMTRGLRTGMDHQNTGSGRMLGSSFDRSRSAVKSSEEMHRQQGASQAMAIQMARAKLRGNSFASGLTIYKAFQFFDTDDSGSLSREEFATAMQALKIPVKNEVIDELISTFDESGDGAIDYKEFTSTFAPGGKSSIYKPMMKTVA